jgi:hypothetical protein
MPGPQDEAKEAQADLADAGKRGDKAQTDAHDAGERLEEAGKAIAEDGKDAQADADDKK